MGCEGSSWEVLLTRSSWNAAIHGLFNLTFSDEDINLGIGKVKFQHLDDSRSEFQPSQSESLPSFLCYDLASDQSMIGEFHSVMSRDKRLDFTLSPREAAECADGAHRIM